MVLKVMLELRRLRTKEQNENIYIYIYEFGKKAMDDS